VSYTADEARRRLLEDLAGAIEQLGVALSCLTEAYEMVDEQLAQALEDQVFRPTQAGYGRARRAFTAFAQRHGLEAAAPEEGSSGTHSEDPRAYLERALQAVERADLEIAELQDSLLPVEVGDRELRDALSGTRELIGAVPGRARALLRGLGR